MPNLCGKWVQDAEGKMFAEDEKELVWTSFSVMGGGLDTVCPRAFLAIFEVVSDLLNRVYPLLSRFGWR